MQVVKSGFVDPKNVTLYGHHWGRFTKVDQVPNEGDLVRINVFVTDPTKNNGKTKVATASNGLEAGEEPVGAYVEVNARVFGKPLAPHPGRVFLRQEDGSYKEANDSDKPGPVSLEIESESDFPNLHGKVVFAEVFEN